MSIVDLRDQVRQAVLDSGLVAEVDSRYVPIDEAEQLGEWTVTVQPASEATRNNLSRAVDVVPEVLIEVDLRKLIGNIDPAATDAAIDLVEAVRAAVEGHQYAGWFWLRTEQDPWYDIDRLAADGVFLARPQFAYLRKSS